MLGFDASLSWSSAMGDSVLIQKKEEIERAREVLLKTTGNAEKYDLSSRRIRGGMKWLKESGERAR